MGDTIEVEQGHNEAERMREHHDQPRVRLSGERKPQTSHKPGFSTAPTVLTPEQLRQLRQIQAAADSNPQAYMEACRRRAR